MCQYRFQDPTLSASTPMCRAWVQACVMVADVWWPFRSGDGVDGRGGAATIILSECEDHRQRAYVTKFLVISLFWVRPNV